MTAEEQMTEEQMKALLDAVKAGNEDEICGMANEHFINANASNNWTNIKAFEEFSGAKIVCLERDSFSWLVGGIKYDGKMYSYG